MFKLLCIINRPGVAGAVLQNSLVTNSFINPLMVCGNIFMAPPRPVWLERVLSVLK